MHPSSSDAHVPVHDQPTDPPLLADVEENTPTPTVAQPPTTLSVVKSLMMPVFLPCTLMQVSASMERMVAPLYLRNALHQPDSMVGSVLGIGGMTTLVGSIPSGVLVGKFGTEWVLLVSVLVVTASYFLQSMRTVLWWFVCGTIIRATGMVFLQTSRQQYIAEHVATNFRGKAMSLIGGTERVSSLIGPLVAGMLLEYSSARVAFMLMGVLSLPSVIPLYTLLRRKAKKDKGKAKEPTIARGPYYKRVATMLHNNARVFATVGLFGGVLFAVRTVRLLILPLAADNSGMSDQEAGVMVSCGYVFDVLLFPLGGYIMDKYGRKWSSVPSTIGLSLAMGCLGLSLAMNNRAMLYVSTFLTGLGNGIGSGVILTIGADHAALALPHERSLFLGIMRTILQAGNAISLPLSGFLSQHFGLATACFVFCVLGLLTGVFGIFFVQETLTLKPKPPPSSVELGLDKDNDEENLMSVNGGAKSHEFDADMHDETAKTDRPATTA